MMRQIRGIGGCLAAMWIASHAVGSETNDPLREIRSGFQATEPPIVMEYQLGYRFLNVELSRLGRIKVFTTTGRWRHRVSGVDMPAVFLDVLVDSADRNKVREQNRVSIHDEIVAVLTLPDLEALVFSKRTDEYLHPLFARRTVSEAVSLYDTQSGALEYLHRNFSDGSVVTNLNRPDELLRLSRQIRPIMDYLVGQSLNANPAVSTNECSISVNLDGQVVGLRLDTQKEKSPACFEGRRLDALRIETLPLERRQARARDFFAWALTFDGLADALDDDRLRKAAHSSMVQCVTPVVVDYELAIGRIRASMVAVSVGTGTNAPAAPRSP